MNESGLEVRRGKREVPQFLGAQDDGVGIVGGEVEGLDERGL